MRSTSWTSSHSEESHSTMPLSKRSRKFIASTPSSRNSKLISLSYSATLQTAWSFLRRRSRNLVIRVSIRMLACFRIIAIVSFMTSGMVSAATLCAQIYLPGALTFKPSMLSSTSIFRKTLRPTFIVLVVRADLVIWAWPSTSSAGKIDLICTRSSKNSVLKFNPFPSQSTKSYMCTIRPRLSLDHHLACHHSTKQQSNLPPQVLLLHSLVGPRIKLSTGTFRHRDVVREVEEVKHSNNRVRNATNAIRANLLPRVEHIKESTLNQADRTGILNGHLQRLPQNLHRSCYCDLCFLCGFRRGIVWCQAGYFLAKILCVVRIAFGFTHPSTSRPELSRTFCYEETMMLLRMYSIPNS